MLFLSLSLSYSLYIGGIDCNCTTERSKNLKAFTIHNYSIKIIIDRAKVSKAIDNKMIELYCQIGAQSSTIAFVIMVKLKINRKICQQLIFRFNISEQRKTSYKKKLSLPSLWSPYLNPINFFLGIFPLRNIAH